MEMSDGGNLGEGGWAGRGWSPRATGSRVRGWWVGQTIQARVVWTCGALLAGAFVVASGTLLNLRVRLMKVELVERLKVEARFAAAEVADEMAAGDHNAAGRTLVAFSGDTSVLGVMLLGRDGGVFAGKGDVESAWHEESVFSRERFSIWDEGILVDVPVVHEGKKVGELRRWSGLAPLAAELWWSVAMFVVVNLMVMVMAVWLLRRLVGLAMEPVAELADTAHRVAEQGDYGIRAERVAEDEVGLLVDSFNRLLSTVEEQQAQLAESHERLSRARRLESLGLLAGGVAHDLNNILGPMVALPGLVAEGLEAGDPRREMTGAIEKSARRASVVIRDLLSLARRGTYTLGEVDLEVLVEECLAGEVLSRRTGELGGAVEVVFAAEKDEGEQLRVEGSEAHLVQLVLNLAINAVEAMEGHGELRVRCHRRVLEADWTGYETVPAGEYVVLSVEDTGLGIEAEAMERLFEPFYSQKEKGNRSGTGLGLAVVYGVVRDHGGYLNVRTGDGGGATFEVFLQPALPGGGVAAAADGTVAVRRAKVLVVDDYDHQRMLTARLLEASGHVVEEASSGSEALVRLGAGRFDLMVVDMIMEDGFDGLDTIRGALELQPGLRCIIATGYSETARVEEALELGASACLSKPYTREALDGAVAEALVGGGKVALAS